MYADFSARHFCQTLFLCAKPSNLALYYIYISVSRRVYMVKSLLRTLAKNLQNLLYYLGIIMLTANYVLKGRDSTGPFIILLTCNSLCLIWWIAVENMPNSQIWSSLVTELLSGRLWLVSVIPQHIEAFETVIVENGYTLNNIVVGRWRQ